MSGINILHLSDLHISSRRLSATSKKLIQDIVAQTIDMDDILLIVSGDIIDKGEYTKYKEGVLCFFQKLKAAIGKKLKELALCLEIMIKNEALVILYMDN